MANLQKKSFDKPDATQSFEKLKTDSLTLDGITLTRVTWQPGWQWSKHLKPQVGTESCQKTHIGYIVSGRIKAVMDDGAELEFGPGDPVYITPGHDGLVVGTEPVVYIEVSTT